MMTQFEFNQLNPGKLCAILSTHLPSSLTPTNTTNSRLYLALLDRIKSFYPSENIIENVFDIFTQVDYKLCELFTAQGLS